jgi:hypothetical protein
MTQQQTQGRLAAIASAAPDSDRERWLIMETIGRDRFRALLQQWLKRNNWSLAVASRLAELALLAQAKVPVPDWTAGMPLQPGSWVNHKGHAWEAVGTPASEPAEGDAGWLDRGLTSRLHASGLNLFIRNKNRSLTATFLLELGRLNEWVARVQAGNAAPPTEQRLRDLVTNATVISDADGALGPEELLSIAVGRSDPPPWPGGTTADAATTAVVPARQLRAAAAAAGLDIIDDWQTISGMYPTADQGRLERLQQLLRGLAQWDLQEEEDERAACLVLLQRLQQHAEQTSGSNAAADVVIPAVVKDISPKAR